MKRLIIIFVFLLIGTTAAPSNTGRIVCKRHYTCVSTHPESCYAYDELGLPYQCCETRVYCPDQ